MEKEKDMDYSLMESNISKSDTSVSSQHSSPDDSDDNTIINELEKTKTELEHYHKLYNETLSKLKYSLADFDNFRKNIERQNSLKVLSIKADLFSAIINIREDFIRALDLIEHNKVDDGVFEGLKNILKTIDSFLEKEGIKEIESLSKVFDPNVHEIIGFSYHDNDNIDESENEGLSLTQISYLESLYNNNMPFPKVLRELLFLAGASVALLILEFLITR